MNQPLTDRDYNSLVDTNKRIEKKVNSIGESLNAFILAQTKVNSDTQTEIESFRNFKKRTVQVFMAFLVTSSSLAAKYTFEDKPTIQVKTEKKEGDK